MLLAEGTFEQFEGGYYRLVRNPRKEGQKTAYYDRSATELGMACILGRPCLHSAARIAKSRGLHVIASGFTGWHPLYDFVDEYWGIIKWNTKENRKDLILKIYPDLEDGPGLVTLQNYDFAPFGLAKPSPRALRLAELAKRDGKYITIAPIKRYNGFQARDFTEWGKLTEELKALGYKVYATCPKQHTQADLPCEYISDIAGEDNVMDLELAFHYHAEACFSSNTGSAGLMLYANCPLLFVFGGVCGYPPGWDGMRDSLSKIEGYRTKLIQPSSGGIYIDQMKDVLQKLEEETK